MITVENVRAGYDDGPDILHQISIDAKPGEIVSILGPNGCGKSTLLKCIAGFIVPRAGSVHISGCAVQHIAVHEKVRSYGLGFVPQTENVFATLTVQENVQLGARHLPPRQSRARCDEVLALYPTLASRPRAKASALSGGERQLLSLARALVANPSILLLDEPSAGLSPKMTDEVFMAIADIRSRLNICILMVEQNAAAALEISDRTYVLSFGRVAIAGTAKEVSADPRVRHLYFS